MPYYTHTNGKPANQTRGLASEVRDEFDKIDASFALIPSVDAIQAGRGNYALDTGIANAYAVNVGSTVLSYVDGTTFLIKAKFANTGPATLNVNMLGLKPIVRPDGTALQVNDIFPGQIMQVSYDATAGKFQLLSSASGSASSAGTSASNARTSETNASDSATTATNAATAAAASAAQAGATLNGTSATSITVGLNPVTLTTQTNKAFLQGQYLALALGTDPAVFMRGYVTAYTPSTGSLTVQPDDLQGAGTFANWNISVSGRRGRAGTSPYVPQASASFTGVTGAINGFENAAQSNMNLPGTRQQDDLFGFENTNGRQDNTVTPPVGDTINGVPGVMTLDLSAGAFIYIGGGRWRARV